MIDGLARNKLKEIADQYNLERDLRLKDIPPDILYEEPLQPPTIAGGLISLDPTDYLLGMPLARIGKANKLAQLANSTNRQSGYIDPEIAQYIAVGAATPAIGYGLGRYVYGSGH